MKSVDLETVRLFLHVLAATVWVGGQLTLAALVPALRAAGADVPKSAANAFNKVAWPAFGILVLTGVWNVIADQHDLKPYQGTLGMKYAFVLLSGVTAYMHTRAKTKKATAIWGALTAITALGALFIGVLLAQ